MATDAGRGVQSPAPERERFHREHSGRAELPYLVFGELYIVLALIVSFGVVEAATTPLWLAVSALGVGVALIAPLGAISRVFVSVPLILFLVWTGVSIAWSADPTTFRHELLQVVPIAFATILVSSLLPISRIVRSVKVATLGGLALTIGSMIVHPSTTTVANLPEDEGTQLGWHGLFDHKNGMMAFVALAVVTFIALEERRWLKYTVVVTSFVLALGAQSSTGMSVLIGVCIAAVWLNSYLRQSSRFTSAFMTLSVFGGIALIGLLTMLLPAFVNLYGKDLTFNGRTEIWSASIDSIKERPVLGYGLDGVWKDPSLEPTSTMLRQIGFRAWHAHSSVLELLLELGVVGLVLYLSWFASVFVAGWRALQTAPTLGKWVLLFCVMQIVMSLSEVMVFGGWLVCLILLRAVLARSAAPLEPLPPDAVGRRSIVAR
ncbi:MAG TPA: O-antigen ligase family protein [Acidimicrobiales bacterium]|nr:O-antigen ligase family protein [Acidimicrobiales bacterium]